MTNWEPPLAEDDARSFGEWKVWFEWGSAPSDDRGKGVPPAWFARRANARREIVPASDLTGAEFRRRLRELMDAPAVEAIWSYFEPLIADTSVGRVLTPLPRH